MTRIMAIEDDPQVRVLLRHMLSHAGYDVVTAADGREAMKLQREKPAKLVVTDILMPEQEGLETIRQLRRDYPETQIIAISGGGEIDGNHYLQIARGMGARKILAKPFSYAQLMEAVNELLGGPAQS